MLVFGPTWVHAGDAGQEPLPISDADYFYYIQGDYLGSASVLTEGMANGKHMGLTYLKGQLLQKYEYKPFGQEHYVLNPNLWMDPRYTDQSYDIESGLYYYQSRFYNPKLKRFIQPDTIVPDPTDLQSWNRYSYVKNNPLRYKDPSGHEEEAAPESDEPMDGILGPDPVAEAILGPEPETAGTPMPGDQSTVDGITDSDQPTGLGAAEVQNAQGEPDGGESTPAPATPSSKDGVGKPERRDRSDRVGDGQISGDIFSEKN